MRCQSPGLIALGGALQSEVAGRRGGSCGGAEFRTLHAMTINASDAAGAGAAPTPDPATGGTLPATLSPDGRFCIGCAYMLTGLAWEGVCPECGTSIALSVREPTLANADRAYITRIRSGLSLVLGGTMTILFFFAAKLMYGTAMHFLGAGPGPAAVEVVTQCLGLLILFVVMAGYWKYTEPDPGQVALEVTKSARSYIRLAVIGLIVLSTIVCAIEIVQGPSSPAVPNATPVATAPTTPPAATPTPGTPALVPAPAPPVTGRDLLEVARVVVSVVTLGVWSVLFVAMMRYTRWLGTRVPDFLIVRRTKTYMWLLPLITVAGTLLLAVGFIIGLLMYWTLLHRMNTHLRSIERTGKPAALKDMVPAE